MKIDASIPPGFAEAGRRAVQFESTGYDGVWSTEAGHDPFLPLVSAARETASIELGTAIAVAFAHSPLSVAQVAHDLNVESGGRFTLGLGSQVKSHVTRRYSMAWSRPAARMREYVLALQAIWSAWNDDQPLEFRGEFFQHTLMSPFFSPGASSFGPPKVFIAGVNVAMTQVAGEVADGFLAHPFTTERYLREVTLPALEAGRQRRPRPVPDFEVALPVLLVTGDTELDVERTKRAAQEQIAFYASTAAYRPVLAVHGWEDLQVALASLVRAGRWQDMAALIDDEVLDAFAVVEEAPKLAVAIRRRFDGIVQRVSAYQPAKSDEPMISAALTQLRSAS